MLTSCKLTQGLTLQSSNCHIPNHRIIVELFVDKGCNEVGGNAGLFRFESFSCKHESKSNSKPVQRVHSILFGLLLLFAAGQSCAQVDSLEWPATPMGIPALDTSANHLQGPALDVFYAKLQQLQRNHRGQVRIVHIGDSHLQAGQLAGEMRINLQRQFGNAGRGLVFPYTVALSNSPEDLKWTSKKNWQFNRVAHPEIPLAPGISGFLLQTRQPGAAIHFRLKPDDRGEQHFSIIRVFGSRNPLSEWLLTTPASDSFHYICLADSMGRYDQAVTLPSPTNAFTLQTIAPDTLQQLYGFSLEDTASGLLYHSIGVNGARYENYSNTPLFWEQLPALQADLFIVSLGTNEAQKPSFDPHSFDSVLQVFVGKMRAVAPKADILLTTAADSYKKGIPNKMIQQVDETLVAFCQSNSIAYWDLNRVTLGLGSAKRWWKLGLLNADKVHFTGAAYQIHGRLLYHALMEGYWKFVQVAEGMSVEN